MSVDMIARGMAAAAAKGGGGGGTSVQPDWTQNDATAADYIKNRPGAYDAVQETKITEGIFTGQDSEGGHFEVPASVVKVGQQFLVTIEGETTTYTASAVTGAEGFVQFGTFKYEPAETPPENGYLFLLSPGSSPFATCVGFGTYIGKAFTLSYTEPTIHKVAEKYLDLTNTEAQIAAAQEAATNAQIAATDAATTANSAKDAADPNLSPLWGAEGRVKITNGTHSSSDIEPRIVEPGDVYLYTGAEGNGYSAVHWTYASGRFQYTVQLSLIVGEVYTLDISGRTEYLWDGKSMGSDSGGKITFDHKTGLYSWTANLGIKGKFALSASNKHALGSTNVFAAATIPPYVATPALLMISSTADSTKLFRVTVDDSGALTATEVDM